MSSFRIPPNHHLAMVVGAIFAVGLGCGVLTASLIYGKKVEELERTAAGLATFNQTQATTISQLSLDQSLPKAPTQPAQAPQPPAQQGSPAAAVQAPAASPPPPAVPPAAKAQAPAKAPAKPAAPPPAPRQEPPKLATPPAQPQAPTQARTTPAQALEALKAQRQSTPAAPGVATVTMEQAGISGIDTASVKFASGRTVVVGGEFPTGEKLLSVHPADGRIVTDRRTIQLAKPAPAQ